MGKWNRPEYQAWYNAWSRCHKPTHHAYKNYGGRGIRMCEEWAQSFEAFFAHIAPRPSAAYSLGRIDDDKGYEPGDSRWETRLEQYNHSRAAKIFGQK